MEFLEPYIRFELRTKCDTVPTNTIRLWVYHLRSISNYDLEAWLQSLINQYPSHVPKDKVLPRFLLIYKIT